MVILGISMVTLTIGNSYSKISGMSPKQDKGLREVLSYTVGENSQYYGGFGPRKKSLLSKRGEFPTGLLDRACTFFHNNVTIVDERIKPFPDSRSPAYKAPKPYPDQLKAVDAAVINHRGIISMPTGTGKSLVIALIASRLNLKTLVVVPSLEIRWQLEASILEVLGPKHKVTIRNIDSTELKKLTDFDCLIIDEAHHVAARTYQKLNKTTWAGIYYRFMLTATPFRNNSEETLLFEGLAGNLIYKLDYKDAVTRGYIVPVEAYYLEVPKTSTDAFTWQQVYKQLVVNNTERNRYISALLFSLALDQKSTLCLVKEVAHGNNINWPSFVNGADNDSRKLIEKFNAKELPCLIGTTGILGEGVDTRPCEFVIIAGLGKAKSQLMQQIGRAVRRYPGKESAKVILIKDRSHKFCLRHFNEQVKIIKNEYGITPLKLEI